MRNDDDELFTPPTTDDVFAARRCVEPVSDLAQHIVTAAVTVRVVDGLELIHVDEHHGQGIAVSSSGRCLDDQLLVEMASVRETGQRISSRNSVELGVAFE